MIMNPLEDIQRLIELLARAEKELIYLGAELRVDGFEGLVGSIEMFESFGLDSGLAEYAVENVEGAPYQFFWIALRGLWLTLVFGSLLVLVMLRI